MTESLYFGFGVTRHKRVWPKPNTFTVGSVFVRLPMRAIANAPPRRLAWGLLGLNRAAPLGFADKDHFKRSAVHGSALAALDSLLIAQGMTSCAGAQAGEVWLHTFPRVLGMAFKPVSFWFCHDKAGDLRAVVAEVHNTFGEQHCYLLHHPDQSVLRDGQTLTAEKVFHVSPFFPVRGQYQFRWHLGHPGHLGRGALGNPAARSARSVVRIDYRDDEHHPLQAGEMTLVTSISGDHKPVGVRTCLRVLFGFPLHSLTVVLRIHYQALRLWCKGARFYRLPSKPPLNVTHSQ
jgi:uncharacterized protein